MFSKHVDNESHGGRCLHDADISEVKRETVILLAVSRPAIMKFIISSLSMM
jgi:hypothetical protein